VSLLFLKYCTNGNAELGSAATPNKDVSQSSSRDPLPGRIDDARPRRFENMERMLAR
jgi:hypothetical protein